MNRHVLPRLRSDKNACESPHVVLLGAGASLAATPRGDRFGRPVPLMNNLVEVLQLQPILDDAGIRGSGNFEELFGQLSDDQANAPILRVLEQEVHDYFSALRLPEQVTLYDELLLSL